MEAAECHPIDTRVYIGVGSVSLHLDEVSAVVGLAPTAGWSVGELSRLGRPREWTFFELDSGCPGASSLREHLWKLLDRAERVAEAIDASEGALDFARLEVVQSFERPSVTELVLDERWLRALQKMRAWLDVDQYIDVDGSDVERPETPEGVMIGQTLRFRLHPVSDFDSGAVELTEDDRCTSEVQDAALREYLKGLDVVPEGGYVLEIEQTMIERAGTETGFALSRETLSRAYPTIREVRLRMTVLPNSGAGASGSLGTPL